MKLVVLPSRILLLEQYNMYMYAYRLVFRISHDSRACGMPRLTRLSRVCGKDQSAFQMQSLPFGACSAVFSFNRISRSLHHLCMHLCKNIGGVFFDDFPLLEPSLTAQMASLSVEGLLSALGWKYAQGSDKEIPFADSFDLLGVRLEVDAMLLARISLENKPGRVTKLLAQLHGGFHYGENFESCLSGYRECPIWTALRQAANQSVRCVP